MEGRTRRFRFRRIAAVLATGIPLLISSASGEDLSVLLEKAGKGDAAAQVALGSMYREGKGVRQDDAEAAKWYRKAAEQGVAEAQSSLGVFYANGKGVSRDYAEAVRWYRKGAEQGDPNAQHGLGVMYHNGFGVPRDDDRATTWFRKAAEQGHYGKVE